MSKVRETHVRRSVLQEVIRGKTHWNHNHRNLVSLITLEPQTCLTQWNLARPCGASQVGQVMVDKSDRMWSTGEEKGNPLQYSCLEMCKNSMKRQNDWILKEELSRSLVSHMLLEIGGERTPERMKALSPSKNNTQLWMWLVTEERSNAIKTNIA